MTSTIPIIRHGGPANPSTCAAIAVDDDFYDLVRDDDSVRVLVMSNPEVHRREIVTVRRHLLLTTSDLLILRVLGDLADVLRADVRLLALLDDDCSAEATA